MLEAEFRLYQRKVLEELSEASAVINEKQIRIGELEYCNQQLKVEVAVSQVQVCHIADNVIQLPSTCAFHSNIIGEFCQVF